MALSRRPYVLVSAAGVAVVVAFAIVVITRNERPPDDTRGAPSKASLVFAEFGTDSDRVFRADARDPSDRSLVATIPHAPEWGINPAAQAAGELIAYTVLPPNAMPARETPAELYVLDVAEGERRLLASDADLLTPPVLDRDGSHVAYRRNGALGLQSLVSVDLANGTRRTLFEVETTFGVYPVGFDPNGNLLFASLSLSGTDLFRAGVTGQPERVLHASDEVARDWQVSPDGRYISFVAPEVENERVVHRMRVVDLTTLTPRTVSSARPPAVEEFTPVWRPDGAGITVGHEAFPEQNAGAVTYPLAAGTPSALAAPAQGYDVPAGWSADGEYLAVRSFDGSSAQSPGDETLVIVSREGERTAVTTATELVFLGWVAANG